MSASEKPVTGVYAAVPTHRDASGALDENAMQQHLVFLAQAGIDGVVLNGATGEYCLTTRDELRRILAVACGVLGQRAAIVCGIGAPGLAGCLERATLAMEAGARAVLLPMPYFFPYEQDDLEEFCQQADAHLRRPVLLYNLPQFTTGLAPATVRQIVENCKNITGIKDSSGSLDILQLLTRVAPGSCRIVGNDSVLATALERDLCDGVISGVAGVVPELILALYAQRGSPQSEEFTRASRALDEFIAHADVFPVPWALKWLAEARGIAAANFAQPVSARRMRQADDLQQWFQTWYSQTFQGPASASSYTRQV